MPRNRPKLDATADSTKVGAKIRAHRKAIPMTLAEAAEATEVALNYISRLERGELKYPSAEALSKVAKGLGMDEAEVMAAAGYVSLAEDAKGKAIQPKRVAIFAGERLTAFEKKELLRHLQLLRRTKAR